MTPTLATSSAALPPEGAHFALGRPGGETVSASFEGLSAFPLEGADGDLLDERALSKLRWRCRRGLLENDLFIERFFKRHESGLTVGQARGLNELMDLADNDLLDLLLRRKEPGVDITTTAEVREVLAMLRT